LGFGESFQHCHRDLIAEERGVARLRVGKPLTCARFMIDLHLLHLINREWTHPVLDRLMPVISDLKAWVPVIAVTVVTVLWWSGGRSWRKVVGIGLCLLVTDNLVGYPMKHLAGKQRPNESVAWVLKRSPAKHPVRPGRTIRRTYPAPRSPARPAAPPACGSRSRSAGTS
jgi:hypothetical protein